MSSKMKKFKMMHILIGFLTLFIIALTAIAYTDYSIQQLIEEKRFLVPTQYMSSPKKFYVGQVRSLASFKSYLINENYREREFGATINVGDFSTGNKQDCESIVKSAGSVFACVFFRPSYSKKLYLVNINELDQITSIFSGDDLQPSLFALGEAEIFAQYLGDRPTQQTAVALGDIPRYCLDAVIAIEDPDFLQHQGISVRGIFRAILANARNVKWSQGGSTITQQLVKNYFLTPEKTIMRKVKEIAISLIFEFRVSKDDILETYLNIIYLGQSGVFEIRGYGSASSYYLHKPIEQANLSDCALLAAIVNSPGRYNPITQPEQAKTRRNRVLTKMLEQKMISDEELQEADKQDLPKHVKGVLSASAPYYVDAVNKKLIELGIKDRAGLKVFTALDPQAQKLAEKAVQEGIAHFEESYPHIKKAKKQDAAMLQAAHLASNPITGDVIAIVGGRNFSTSPYNRAIDSKRQVGSIFKPFVYLTALQKTTEPLYTPVTLLNNSPYKLEYDRKIWEPRNYDNTYSAPVPMFYALKESLNVPTARLAMDVGLDNVIATARSLGIDAPLKEYPSISLGAFEIKPMEVLRAYNTIAKLGEKQDLKIVKMVTNQRGEILYANEPNYEQVGNPADYAVLIGMMKETFNSGSGEFARDWGFLYFAAGKTGTTTDSKDSWFVGFTPFHTAVTWVGYDSGMTTNLTGAAGALPIWARYMKEISKFYLNKDFDIPPTVHKGTVSGQQLLDLGIPALKAKDTELVFKNE